MPSLSAILTTFSLTLFLLTPRNTMLLSLPRIFSPTAGRLSYSIVTFLAAGVTFAILFRIAQFTLAPGPSLNSVLPSSDPAYSADTFSSGDIGSQWHAPEKTDVNDLASAINGNGPMGQKVVPRTGAGASEQPEDWEYGEYNYCNMPHVRTNEYVQKDEHEWELIYVEVIQRHHKRTPYASSTFPVEGYSWNCDDAQLYQYGRPHPADGKTSASTYWRVIDNKSDSKKVNPFTASGFPGTCQFPQITRGGLDDSWQHGSDLYGVYHDLLHLIPDTPLEVESANSEAPWHDQVRFRVTNNPITSQVAGMLLNGMFGVTSAYPLLIQPKAIDSLEPSYACPRALSIYQSYGVGSSYLTSFPSSSASSRSRWLNHLASTRSLFARLDSISGIDTDSRDWHQSWDHYFDSLSSRLCHSKPLPCNAATGVCITQAEAEEVFRLGMWEYSHIYRDSPESLEASAAGFGVWLAELAQHLREAVSGESQLQYMHNVAHDGSVSKLLSILQVEKMVWPGLGSEVVFELFRRKQRQLDEKDEGDDNRNGMSTASLLTGDHTKDQRHDTAAVLEDSTSTALSDHYIRILWGGRVFKSSHPALGMVDMLPLETFLDYIDDLVGVRASKVRGMCGL